MDVNFPSKKHYFHLLLGLNCRHRYIKFRKSTCQGAIETVLISSAPLCVIMRIRTKCHCVRLIYRGIQSLDCSNRVTVTLWQPC